MTHRKIQVDGLEQRKRAYIEMEQDGRAQRALWQAVETIHEAGLVEFPESVVEVLEARKDIKRRCPKG